ncbi:MAG TPA: lipid-binding SYLF domain-containing protein [Bryobacteraceae bacterium]|nr:lipid-binding SYLF domain-containing protein [Bryobacteraceae bacterium]
MRKTQTLLLVTIAAVVSAAGEDNTAARLGKATAVLNKMTQSGSIPVGKLASADCVVVIPGFKKGAVVVGVGHGRGFISCRNGGNWSAPGAIALDSGSLGVQLGGEQMNIVILSMDRDLRSKVLSDRFAIGSDASAAWGNGASAHGDANSKILLYGQTKGAFAGFDLDGATLKPDDSGNKALYGRTLSNGEIIAGATAPSSARTFVATIAQASSH